MLKVNPSRTPQLHPLTFLCFKNSRRNLHSSFFSKPLLSYSKFSDCDSPSSSSPLCAIQHREHIPITRHVLVDCLRVENLKFHFLTRPCLSFPVTLRFSFIFRLDSNLQTFKSFSIFCFPPTMESPGSDLVADEQLVRKNSHQKASSSTGFLHPRQTTEPNLAIPTQTPSARVDGPRGNRSGLMTV
ncbi:hypothetical protein FNV43_RR01969 [Rhamnella rubrinervis]|uniref:Uncharacterized protein n=1 Tax=Rhamnella rubrinervis TaxID=2594499 RepID=A0A8K0MST4_9ROSA|nr:hypothetical protein FNV43_RR01969 [Rhamnella rubrinervis]